MPKSWRWPLFLSGLILLSQGFPLPSPVRDASTGNWVSGFTLHLPRLYILFAPFCGIADRLTLLSYHQAIVFLVYLVAGSFIFLRVRQAGALLGTFIVYLAWVILIPHPQARLAAKDSDTLLIDFHSHTSFSHDGRKYFIPFTPERNMRWHADQGYGAAFITDHNLIDASKIAKEISRKNWQRTGYRSLEGEEASLYKTHLVILGVHEKIDNRPYDSDPAKVKVFISDMHKKHIPVIASIPEYWWYHWDGSPLGTYADFITWGIDGFEIINSAPKALDFPPSYRHRIVELCWERNLPITGVSDNHGWGYATATWNAMKIPGWRDLDPDQLEAVVIQHIKLRGFSAVQGLQRARFNPRRFRGFLASPVLNAGIYWRSLTGPEVVSWLAWIWMGWFLCRKRRNVGT